MSASASGQPDPSVSPNKPWWSAIHESRPTYRASTVNESRASKDPFDAYFEDEAFTNQGLDPNIIQTWILEAEQKATEGAIKQGNVHQRSSPTVSEARLGELPPFKKNHEENMNTPHEIGGNACHRNYEERESDSVSEDKLLQSTLEFDQHLPHGGVSRADSLSYDELISESIPYNGPETSNAQVLKQPALIDKMIDFQLSSTEIDEKIAPVRDITIDGQMHRFDSGSLDGLPGSPPVHATTLTGQRKIERHLSQMLETPMSPLFRDQQGRPYGIGLLMGLYLKGEYNYANLKFESLEQTLNEICLSSRNGLASTSILLEEPVGGIKDPGKRKPSPREDWYRMTAGLSLVDESPEDLIRDSQTDQKGGSVKAGMVPSTSKEAMSPGSTGKLCISKPAGGQKDIDRGTSTNTQEKYALSPRILTPPAQRSPSYPIPAELRLKTMHSATRRPSRSSVGRTRESASSSHGSLMRPISPATLVSRPLSQPQSPYTPADQTSVRDGGRSLGPPAKDFLSEYISFDTKIAESHDTHPALRAENHSLHIEQSSSNLDTVPENYKKESRRSHISRSSASLESPIPHWHGHQRVPSAYLHSPSQSPISAYCDHITESGLSSPFPAPVTPLEVEHPSLSQTPVLGADSRPDRTGYKYTEEHIRKVQSEAPLRYSSDSVQSASSFGKSTPITPFSRYHVSPRSKNGQALTPVHAYKFQKPPSSEKSSQRTWETCPSFRTASKKEACSENSVPFESVSGLRCPSLPHLPSGKSFTQRSDEIYTKGNISETSTTDLLHPQVFASSESSETSGDNQEKDTCSQTGNSSDKEPSVPEEPILPRRIYLGCENASTSTCFLNRKDDHVLTHDDQRSSMYSTTIRPNGPTVGLGIATNCPLTQIQSAARTPRPPERTLRRRTAKENDNQLPSETLAQGTASHSHSHSHSHSPSNALSSQKLARLLGREALSAPSVSNLPRQSADERRKRMVEDWLAEESAGAMKKAVQRGRKVPPPSLD
ncbi:MAG: hypothetical protein LQ351_001411 [Letrouitia transgressa]|nr:MAG: hypothetical protein LQ351_001411 [Letrouitia transgressa]